MFRVLKDEGDVLKNGFNFYPLKTLSLGFKLKLGKNVYMLRYSKITKRIFAVKLTTGN